MKINEIKDPRFLKNLSNYELNNLSAEIREFLIDSLSQTGGHLSSNLGVVELTVAMHKVFNSPTDKIVFDVGHQAYTHKILTGRADQFSSLRQYKGLSGFIKRNESDHDVWEAGHSSTSLSGALGLAVARDLNKEDHHVVAVIGDATIGGGMALEALNDIGHLGKKLIIILNDNEMSISKNVGALSSSFAKLRSSKSYFGAKQEVKELITRIPLIGNPIQKGVSGMNDRFKSMILKQFTWFEQLNIKYYGVIDGHDMDSLIKNLELSKEIDGPVLLHVVTKKGKGYKYAEEDQSGSWHGVSPFNIETGKSLKGLPDSHESWSNIISWTVEDLAESDDDICCITPAMSTGSKLEYFRSKYPERFFDCGIAEEHATTFAAGLAVAGKKPFLSIYSTFLQRSYDQLSHDVCRQKLPVVLGIDRAGIVGADGETHQGIYDVSFTQHLPNMTITMPKDGFEAQHLMFSAFKYNLPISVRYPRGSTFFKKVDEYQLIQYGTWTKESDGFVNVITYSEHVTKLQAFLSANDVEVSMYNARFIKPFDNEMFDKILSNGKPIVIYEEAAKIGSLGSELITYANSKGYNQTIEHIAIKDEFVQHGDVLSILKDLEMSYEDVLAKVKELENGKN